MAGQSSGRFRFAKSACVKFLQFAGGCVSAALSKLVTYLFGRWLG
jgi:hypothetical protein